LVDGYQFSKLSAASICNVEETFSYPGYGGTRFFLNVNTHPLYYKACDCTYVFVLSGITHATPMVSVLPDTNLLVVEMNYLLLFHIRFQGIGRLFTLDGVARVQMLYMQNVYLRNLVITFHATE
jgi:hypothetical protein